MSLHFDCLELFSHGGRILTRLHLFFVYVMSWLDSLTRGKFSDLASPEKAPSDAKITDHSLKLELLESRVLLTCFEHPAVCCLH